MDLLNEHNEDLWNEDLWNKDDEAQIDTAALKVKTPIQDNDLVMDMAIEGIELKVKMRALKKVHNELVLVCEAALLLRGIAAAILDPMALAGEKENYRRRYKEIEEQIRGALAEAARRS